MVEAAGLAHDLGHPPFGHVAEHEILQLVEVEVPGRDDAKEGFEGNAQSFRIVTKLAVRRQNAGLNLTRATLNAVLKYPWRRQNAGYRSEKWGFYSDEETTFNKAREAAIYRNSKTLEAAIMDWADDIAYAIYDMDDCYRAGLIPLNRLIDGSTRELNRFFDDVDERMKVPKNNKALRLSARTSKKRVRAATAKAHGWTIPEKVRRFINDPELYCRRNGKPSRLKTELTRIIKEQSDTGQIENLRRHETDLASRGTAMVGRYV